MDRVLHPDTPKNLRSTTRHLCSDYSRSRREIAALHIDYAPHETEMRRFLAIRPIEIAAIKAAAFHRLAGTTPTKYRRGLR